MKLPKPTKQKKKFKGHKFTPKTSEAIYERDGWKCVYCTNTQTLTPHHVYWKTFERVRDGTQNEVDKGITLCFACHRLLHDGFTRIDDFCKTYLSTL